MIVSTTLLLFFLKCFLAESALLEVTLDQQATFLDKENVLVSLSPFIIEISCYDNVFKGDYKSSSI